MFGIYLGTAAVVGFSLGPLSRLWRMLYGVVALAVVLPPKSFAGAIWINAIGVTLAVVLLGCGHAQRRTAQV